MLLCNFFGILREIREPETPYATRVYKLRLEKMRENFGYLPTFYHLIVLFDKM